ncbi:MAG: hypothetical protein RLZZ312_1014 [Bacteroidota bacterium]
MKPIAIAHRGYSGTEPENTLLAFQKSIDLNCNGIELDVHKTADDHIIVFHDFEIAISQDKIAPISSLTLADIKSIILPKNQKIPTLIEVLHLVNKHCFVNIELKGNNTEQLVCAIIHDFINQNNWSYAHFLVSSFKPELLVAVKFIDNKIPIAIIVDSNLEQAIDFAQTNNLFAIHPNYKILNQQLIAEMQNKNLKVFTWTVNNPEDIKTLTNLGIDGIISDFPDRI